MENLTATEENYLKAIYLLGVSNSKVGTNAIAYRLDTSAASVSEMLKKLSLKKTIHYEKYKGVRLTQVGEQLALKLIRKHRLWETFLVQTLGFDWAEVHDIAEQLEHIDSDALIERLDQFLGKPPFDPHGDPIPNSKGEIKQHQHAFLATINPDTQVQLVRVIDDDDQFLHFLTDLNIRIGTQFRVLQKFPFNNSMKIQFDDGLIVLLDEHTCKHLKVIIV